MDKPVSEEQLAHIREILERPYGELSELAELVEDESLEPEAVKLGQGSD